MRIKHSIYFLLLFTSLFAACKKDLGNYDYQDINSVEITNIPPSLESYRGDSIKVNPQLSFSMDNTGDVSLYTYQWFVIDDSNLPVTKTVIGEEKNLSWQVNLPSVNAAYKIYFRVTEKSTGQIWESKFPLKVVTDIADGWLVLNEINSESRLDFFNFNSTDNNFKYYQDVLASFSTLKLQGKPKLVYSCFRRHPFTSAIHRCIFVGTDQHTFSINTQANGFDVYENLIAQMAANYPSPYYAEKVRAMGASYLTYMIDSKGFVNFENPTQRSVYGTAINQTSDGILFPVSPFIAEAYAQNTSYLLMFDTEKKRFLEHRSTNRSSSVPATTSGLFDMGNVGMDLKFMDSTPAQGGEYYALLKDAANKIFLARMSGRVGLAFVQKAFFEIDNAPELLTATQITIDPAEGYIMYVAGSRIFRYNPFDKTNTMVVDLGSRKISLIKYQKMVYSRTNTRYIEYSRKLIICSYDEAAPNTSGKMELYTVPNLNGELTLYQSFDGLGKIVDVSYRE